MKEFDKRVKCIEENMDEFSVEVRYVVANLIAWHGIAWRCVAWYAKVRANE